MFYLLQHCDAARAHLTSWWPVKKVASPAIQQKLWGISFWIYCTLNRRISVHSYVHILDQWAGSPHFMNRNVITWNEHPSVSLHPTNEGYFFQCVSCPDRLAMSPCYALSHVPTDSVGNSTYMFCFFLFLFCFFHAEADDVEERARSFMILRVGGRWWW